MIELLEELIENLKCFNQLGDHADSRLSKIGERDKASGNLEFYIVFWKKLMSESHEETAKIIALAPDFPNNKKLMSQSLAFYRSLSRYMAECPPVWSVYYDKITEQLRSSLKIVRSIDRQYKLGQHVND